MAITPEATAAQSMAFWIVHQPSLRQVRDAAFGNQVANDLAVIG